MIRRVKFVLSARRSIGAGALLVVLVLSGVLNVGCETAVGPVRASGFPPDLEYIPKERLQTAMWVLAADIKELERVLGAKESGLGNETQRRLASATIDRMRVAAHTLERPGRSSQHPVLNENLDVFMSRLDRAKRALDREPPDFFPASTIAGSCYLCHGRVKATATGGDNRNTLGG